MLQVRGLSRSYRNQQKVLNNINISFPEGSFTIIAGPNGSGKTQLMRHLNGLLKAQEGEVLLRGESIQKDLNHTRRSIGLVFQNADSQIVGQTVASDIAFGPENLRWPREKIREATEQVIRELSLEKLRDRRPHTLSGGEKRRTVLAAVLVMNPDVIVLDEPFTGLDYPGVQDILKDIVRQNKEGRTIILISHDLEKVLAHSTQLVLMNKGEITASGRAEELLPHLEEYGIRRPWGENRTLKSMTWLKP
ncbi:MAG: ABC transporter ATP-binding protein [Spirochaetaceae bacterium 4572_59]|nr:MAG: ABC transporter ATP-binding protein [Spirochaetaceae bacterium 4572_59]